MATITLTAGLSGGSVGYGRVGGSAYGAFGSISAEPLAGYTLDYIDATAGSGYYVIGFVGNTVGTLPISSFTVNGNVWNLDAGAYQGAFGSTLYNITITTGAGLSNGVAYTVDMSGTPVDPNITSAASISNLVNTTLAHTITADKTIASTAIMGGADAAAFEINGTAQLRFASNAASSALGSLVVDVEITDTDGLTDTQTITVTVKAIIFKGSKSYSRAGATGTATSSLTDFANPLTGATGIAAAVGDTVVVFPAIGSTADRDMIINTGYAEQADHYSNGTTYDANIGLFTKTLSSADTTVTFGSSGSTSDAQGGIIMLFQGVDATTPMDVAVVLGNGTGTGKPDPASITPVTTGAVGIFGGAQAAATAVALTSSDLTAFRQIIQADTNDIAVGAGFIEWTSGAINPAAFGGGSSNAANSWATVSAVLRPTWTGGGATAAVGRSNETDTAYALGRVQQRSAALGSETDAALAPVGQQRRTVGLATEANTASALSRTESRATGCADEIDTAYALSVASVSLAVGLATEGDTAAALGSFQTRSVDRADEAETAYALAQSEQRQTGRAGETNAALSPVAHEQRTAGLATESDTAGALGSAQSRSVALAIEADSAAAPARSEQRQAGHATEADTAYALSAGGTSLPVGLAIETSTALSPTAEQRLAVARATETDNAWALGAIQSRSVARAAESNTATAPASHEQRQAGRADEASDALALGAAQVASVGRADEADTAYRLRPGAQPAPPASTSAPQIRRSASEAQHRATVSLGQSRHTASPAQLRASRSPLQERASRSIPQVRRT